MSPVAHHRQKGAPGFSPVLLASALQETGQTPSTLAKTGLNPNLINKFLRGERSPSPRKLHELAEALGISGLQLLEPGQDGTHSAMQRRFAAGITTMEAGRTLGISGVTYARREAAGLYDSAELSAQHGEDQG